VLAVGAALAAAIGFGVAAVGSGWLGVWPPPAATVGAGDAAQVGRGRRIYAEHCASCHGANLEGQPEWRSRRSDGRLPAPPHDASGHTWHHPDGVLFRITKHGPAAIVGEGYESDMPGFAGVLSDAEIRAALAFIKSTWPDRERAFQDRQSRAETRR
jgi:mono/diheme cytochrome c family protein